MKSVYCAVHTLCIPCLDSLPLPLVLHRSV
jgi:hypothetical protein